MILDGEEDEAAYGLLEQGLVLFWKVNLADELLAKLAQLVCGFLLSEAGGRLGQFFVVDDNSRLLGLGGCRDVECLDGSGSLGRDTRI